MQGGPEQVVKALNRNLDIDIDDYATFNWKAVADAINILGGIDVEITNQSFIISMRSFLRRSRRPASLRPSLNQRA